MQLLQFSTSHYCRKARLALGYKGIPYQVKNLTPGLHILTVKPLSGLTTLPVLLPQAPNQPAAIADSTRILKFLDQYTPDPPLVPLDEAQRQKAWLLEDWLDESLGTATRFVYYQFRAGTGRSLDASLLSQTVIQVVRQQYGIREATATLAAERLQQGLQTLAHRWLDAPYLVGDRLSVADIAAAALLSPLARIPNYRNAYPWLFERIKAIHQSCHETLPPDLEE
jgi:glutathione S-transferase